MANPTDPSQAPPKAPSWFAHLPTPRSAPEGMSVGELQAALATAGQQDVLVVDVRRADIEVRPPHGLAWLANTEPVADTLALPPLRLVPPRHLLAGWRHLALPA